MAQDSDGGREAGGVGLAIISTPRVSSVSEIAVGYKKLIS